jgi:type I restriction enzyme S subunit
MSNSRKLSFEEVFSVLSNEGKSLKQREYLREGKFPVIDQGETKVGGYTNRQDLVLNFGHPVIIFGDHTRNIKLIDSNFVPGADGTKILKPNKGVSLKFAYYSLLSKELRNRGYARHFSELKKEEFWLPSAQEQEKIVEILEDHLSRLDAALADVKQAKLKGAQFRRSLLHAAFEGTLSMTYPSGWKSRTLTEVATVIMGQSPPGSSYNETGDGIPFFQGKAEFGEVHPTVRKYTTAGTKHAKSGDILMSVRAPVGPTNIADIDCVIGRGLAAIRGNELISQKYLTWTLKHLELEIQGKGKGTTFDSISGDALRGTVVYLPELPEQEKIVEILEDHLSRLDASMKTADYIEFCAAALRRSLLQAAFTGQLTKEEVDV